MAAQSSSRGAPRPSPAQLICNPLRVMVSQNRRRFTQEGFNLDLTYITDRIIAMGYPADTTEALYRNSMTHIVQFLEKYHHGHYKVFNLRGSYVYDTSHFHGRVTSFEMTDHHPPRLEYMAPFCREVHAYLEADPKNVVAVHCKAGKGRTGVMICAYLVYISFYPSPRQNMDYYSIGVTIPSQRRYVYYFSHLRKHRLNYMPLRVELVGVYVERPPRIGSAIAKGALSLRVSNGDVVVFEGEDIWFTHEMNEAEMAAWADGAVSQGEDQHDPYRPVKGRDCVSRRCYGWETSKKNRVFIQGDVRIDIFSKTKVKVLGLPSEKKKIGHLWINTTFACPLFCGCVYIHGDELYPYPPGGTTIASTLPSQQNNSEKKKAGSASVPSSPPLPAKGTRGSGSVSSSRSTMRTPSFDTRKKTGKAHANSADATSARASEPQINGGGGYETGEDRVQLLRPPGLDAHCPPESLRAIYPDEQHAPRHGIEEMLREAHTNNLISDLYNSRRQSIPVQGPLVALAPSSLDGGDPLVRGKSGGPRSLYRSPDEHVQFYSALEVDRAFKNKDVDVGFKVSGGKKKVRAQVIVLMRCIPDNDEDKKFAENFIHETAEKQDAKDQAKKLKLEARHKKLLNSHGSQAEHSEKEAEEKERRKTDDSEDEDEEEDEEDEDNHTDTHDDPRRHDPDLRKFFYRQRSDSTTKYPNDNHKCPLLHPQLQRTSLVCPDCPSTSRGLIPEEEQSGDFQGEGAAPADVERALHSASPLPGLPCEHEWRWSDSTVSNAHSFHPPPHDGNWPHASSTSSSSSSSTTSSDSSCRLGTAGASAPALL